ncbi:MAG: glycosyltransferase [Candidatus Bathyarchaeota archaeon]|nr:glycosyltransferase [Candidatus Bathyarchaeota archaeon]
MLLFIFPALLALIITLLVSSRGLGLIMSFFIVLDMVISFLMMIFFFVYWRLSRVYRKAVLSHAGQPGPSRGKYRIAVVIPVYNENPEIVLGTAIASKMAVEGRGDVYILDDSTDEEIKKELDLYSRVYGFSVSRRNNRKGYKAGAINAWIAKHGGKYDLLVVMDADQRLMPGVFEHVLKFFDDPDVVFVQIPQYYSGLDNTVTLSAYIQQLPFLRVVMRGRSLRQTAFSLGSGTIYRVEHLRSVGGLYEKTVTEDIFTSILLHENRGKQFKSVYVDLPLVWRGEAPNDLSSYMSQQNRWCLGGFQLIRKLLSARLPPSAVLDYLCGIHYWLHVGLLSIADVMAPVLFLVFGIFFMEIDPARYLVVYFPIFYASIMLYLAIMKTYRYGLREFIYHQGIQFVASLPTTLALFEWILRRRKGFKVTPKGKRSAKFTAYHLYYVFIVLMLTLAAAVGIHRIMSVRGALFYAYLINLFWAGWWLVVSASALYVSLALPVPHKFGRKIAQAYEGLEENVLRLLGCTVILERAVADHYLQASKRFKEFSEQLEIVARESSRHAEIYSSLQKSIKADAVQDHTACGWVKPYLSKIASVKESGDLASVILLHEEMTIRVFTQLMLETCRPLIAEAEEIANIIDEEAKHEKILRQILAKT